MPHQKNIRSRHNACRERGAVGEATLTATSKAVLPRLTEAPQAAGAGTVRDLPRGRQYCQDTANEIAATASRPTRILGRAASAQTVHKLRDRYFWRVPVRERIICERLRFSVLNHVRLEHGHRLVSSD